MAGKLGIPSRGLGSHVNLPDEGGAAVAYPSQEESQRQMQRILHSAAFRNSHMLQQLLQFLVAQAYGPEAETLKEYTIGVGALSRPQDFDPKTDPIVRVQTLRLRQKLKEYYDSEGRHDPITIEIPKGHYLPTFEMANGNYGIAQGASEQRNALASSGAPGVVQEKAAPAPPKVEDQNRKGLLRQRAVIAAAGVVVFVAGLLLGSRIHPFTAGAVTGSAASESSFNSPADPVKAFWGSLLGNDTSPIIAHADAVFLLDRHNDLFWFPHGASDYRGAPVDPHLAQQFAADPALVAKAGKLNYEDVYLGSGDLDAVATMANLFGQMGIKPVIEPGKDLTPDDLKQHNVILVGSSFQSYAVSQFNSVGDFTFVNPDSRLGGWLGTIVNSNPRPGEQSVYRTDRDPETGVLKTDHALITIQPGVVPGRYIVDLGGLDTTGCAGAAMFATSVTGVQELKRMIAAEGIHGTNNGPPMFQALLSVRLEKGDEVLGASLVTVHPLYPAQKSPGSPRDQKTVAPSR
ncbi:MAG TPA: hypothetical protein VGR47_11735 [Terracidiphilus sp.]|nr:hypothetical protein [Terracidiphilus sp.]